MHTLSVRDQLEPIGAVNIITTSLGALFVLLSRKPASGSNYITFEARWAWMMMSMKVNFF